MKEHKSSISRARPRLHALAIAASTALISLAGLPVHAATTSFPPYPLLTGGNVIPPNILLIMDDSGSMQSLLMRADGVEDNQYSLADTFAHRSYVNNTLYYNPAKTYLPWRTASTDLNDRMGNADFKSAASDPVSPAKDFVDLRTHETAVRTGFFSWVNVPDSFFYVPNNKNGYDKYRITTDYTSSGYNGGVVERLGKDNEWTAATPTNPGRSQQDELQNFANWYQYHRSRNKMAKAGASEAFGLLGSNYRVGLDTIWNRGGSTVNTSGSAPAYSIPVGTRGGLFTGANRSSFFSNLRNVGASGNTPLHGALQRAARYFGTDKPWEDSSGKLLTCRQNYAILTTDGYWNDYSGYIEVGNSDAANKRDVDGNPPAYPDTYSDTLADVAYEYWSKDLKPGTDWPNNVPTSAGDPADWQHMVTFGVSIGLRGGLDTNNPPPSPWLSDPTTGGEGPRRIDDLWHAALNGHGSFVVASDSEKFASSLQSALSIIDSRSASGSNIASSSTKTDTATLTFVAGFTSGSWHGDLIASPFNAALTGVSSTPKWILSQTFGNGKANKDFTSRTVLTMKDGQSSLFQLNSVANASDFAVRSGQLDAVTAADNIAYLRGIRTKEVGQTGGSLRKRVYPIGDIVDSSPAYVDDTKTLYIGANDGMLHALDATDGKVLFSYIPKGIDYSALANLSSTSYEHQYFVDGQIDVISRAQQGNGKNILVAALGRGGRGVFALDVTAPGSMSTSKVLWDNTTQDPDEESDMGYVLGAVRVRKAQDGKTYAFVPNGIDSQNGSATLFMYELDSDGDISSTIKLVADDGGDNGLMSLGLADLNADGAVDVIYGGDLKGNVWRWQFTNDDSPDAAVQLFQAKDASRVPQPITGGIGVGRDPMGNVFVGFGTGKFISSSDVPGVSTQQQQSIYGIKDEGVTVSGRNALQQRTIPFSGKTSSGQDARGFEAYSALPAGKKGWYIDLVVPERVTSAPTIYGTAMILSSVIPATGNDCEGATGRGFLNAINLFTGTSPASGGYFTGAGSVADGQGNAGVVGSVGIAGGMPTEANVTSLLTTVGTGAFSTENGGKGNTDSTQITPPSGGVPSRVSWREILP